MICWGLIPLLPLHSLLGVLWTSDLNSKYLFNSYLAPVIHNYLNWSVVQGLSVQHYFSEGCYPSLLKNRRSFDITEAPRLRRGALLVLITEKGIGPETCLWSQTTQTYLWEEVNTCLLQDCKIYQGLKFTYPRLRKAATIIFDIALIDSSSTSGVSKMTHYECPLSFPI